jgi:phosphohistidine phosphatase
VSLLVVLRHAKSAWPAGVADRDRPLAPRGERACELVGRFVGRGGLCPERIVCSPARRAHETARRTAHAAGCGVEVHLDERLYEGDALPVVRDQAEGIGRLWVVGHEPELVALVRELTGAHVRLPTGGLVAIETDGPWSDQPGPDNQLRLLVGPRHLAAQGR